MRGVGVRHMRMRVGMGVRVRVRVGVRVGVSVRCERQVCVRRRGGRLCAGGGRARAERRRARAVLAAIAGLHVQLHKTISSTVALRMSSVPRTTITLPRDGSPRSCA